MREPTHPLPMLERVDPDTDAVYTFCHLCAPTGVTVRVPPGERASFIVIRLQVSREAVHKLIHLLQQKALNSTSHVTSLEQARETAA